jgi:ABC-type oligopeptide transport system substrate-binding subunit
MNVRTVDSSQYQARLLNYDFDMIKASWNVSLSPGNEQQFYYGSEVGKKEGSRNYAGVDSEVVDFLIEQLVGAKTREELTTAIHALDRVLLWNHYVIPYIIVTLIELLIGICLSSQKQFHYTVL